MQTVNAVVGCNVADSFRVQQISGMFDVSIPKKTTETFTAELPDTEEDWQIGLIVGPSGSGKTTIAKHAYGERIYTGHKWPQNKAVVDAFPKGLSIREITGTLSSVGFSSPPAWIKPYRVLSNGEKFRCDLAMAILTTAGLTVFDEFTSVVDRTVAKIGSAAVAKAIRRTQRKFIAVSCHYDIAEWLEPDWILDMRTGKLERGRLRRPKIKLRLFRCEYAAWEMFKRHHYLSATLHSSSQCYVTLYEGVAVCFAGVLPVIGQKGKSRVSRIVTLPDYQGVGVATATLRMLGDFYTNEGRKLFIRTGHPAMIRSLEKLGAWRRVSLAKTGSHRHGGLKRNRPTSLGRCVVSFCYSPAKRKRTRQSVSGSSS